ncbi:MAG: sulfite exporter TauE/SafE family protein [Pseudomonadota bacterium]
MLTLSAVELAVLAGAAAVAGIVRGFSGFGTAMIYLPVAGQVVPPIWAVTTLVVMDLVSPLPNAPAAWRVADKRELAILLGGMLIALPLGLLALLSVPAEVFRYGVSVVCLLVVACLIGGLRYRGPMTPPVFGGAGLLAGFLFGSAGLPGPPVLLLYMASARVAEVVRANMLLFLILTDAVYLPMLALFGQLDWTPVLIGAALILPGLFGNVIGARMFRPGRERTYRRVAYAIVAISAVSGLPVWD